MSEMALSISEQENFSSIYDPQGVEDMERRPRRLSVLDTVDKALQFGPNVSQVHSLSAFTFGENLAMDSLLSGFMLLRVLELTNAPIDHVPVALGKLFNLRYLNLKGSCLKELPESMAKLRKLQTLDIRETKVRELPDGIDKLHNLRHLLTYCFGENEQFNHIVGTRVRANLPNLKWLQVLNCIEANGEILKGIGKMTQLKRLELANVEEGHERDLCASLGKLKLLRHLLVMARNETEILKMDALSSHLAPHKPLSDRRKLTLIGKLNSVPPWLSTLSNIIHLHLHLHWSRLREDPIPSISALPSLERLAMVNAYDHGTRQLHFNEGFPKLQDLSLVIFPELDEIVNEKGVMPSLVRLNLRVCARLEKVPHGIEHLTNLEELDLKDVSVKLRERIRGEESVDRSRVRHIPVINNSYQAEDGCAYESLS